MICFLFNPKGLRLLEMLWQKITKKSDDELNEFKTSCPAAHDKEGAAESCLLVTNWDT